MTPDVRVGQVWADNDSRSRGRTIKVLEIVAPEGGEPVAICETLTNDKSTEWRMERTSSARMRALLDRRGKTSRIKVRRFRPTSTGYRLVSEAAS